MKQIDASYPHPMSIPWHFFNHKIKQEGFVTNFKLIFPDCFECFFLCWDHEIHRLWWLDPRPCHWKGDQIGSHSHKMYIAFKWPNGQLMACVGFGILGMPRSSKHFLITGSKKFKSCGGSIWKILYCTVSISSVDVSEKKRLWKAPRPKTSHWGSSCGWTTCRGTVPKHRCSRRRLEMVGSSHCGWLEENRPDKQRCFNDRDYVASVRSHSVITKYHCWEFAKHVKNATWPERCSHQNEKTRTVWVAADLERDCDCGDVDFSDCGDWK